MPSYVLSSASVVSINVVLDMLSFSAPAHSKVWFKSIDQVHLNRGRAFFDDAEAADERQSKGNQILWTRLVVVCGTTGKLKSSIFNRER
jgi:hypothetical protein